MTTRRKPVADVTIDPSVVGALLQEQHGDLASLPLSAVGEGWDNTLFRLGEDLAVRLPRRAASAALIVQEQRWLPKLSRRLPLPIPVPLRVGCPGCGYPFPWSIVPWFRGTNALQSPFQDTVSAAVALGRFLRELHQPAPVDAPHNPWRSVPLDARTNTLLEHLRQADGLVDRVAILTMWDRVVSVPARFGPVVWIHCDLHPGNVLVHGGRLSAVVDFGDLAGGDPATDLAIGWMGFSSSARQAFLASACGGADAVDAQTVLRARGWALALGLAHLANSRDDKSMTALGRATVTAALASVPDGGA